MIGDAAAGSWPAVGRWCWGRDGGAGIPVDKLAGRFERLVLNDHDESLLAVAFRGVGIKAEKTRVETIIADLTGVTGAFLSEIDTTTRRSNFIRRRCDGADDAVREGGAARRVRDGRDVRSGRRVVRALSASPRGAMRGASARFEAQQLRAQSGLPQAQPWVQAMFALASHMEDAFIDALHDLAATGGRIYILGHRSVRPSCILTPRDSGVPRAFSR